MNHVFRTRGRAVVLDIALAAASFIGAGCGSTSAASGDGGASFDGASVPDAAPSAEGGSDAGTPLSSADAAPSDAPGSDVSSTLPDAATPMTYSAPAGSCFDFVTGKSVADCSAGSLMLLMGANVDLQSGPNGVSAAELCDLGMTYKRLADIPASYASCAWTDYVEGAGGLAGESLIVRNADGSHHWKVYIVSNTLPNLVFEYAAID
jgi:hypothetical protein